jgi:hypothetical protein
MRGPRPRGAEAPEGSPPYTVFSRPVNAKSSNGPFWSVKSRRFLRFSRDATCSCGSRGDVGRSRRFRCRCWCRGRGRFMSGVAPRHLWRREFEAERQFLTACHQRRASGVTRSVGLVRPIVTHEDDPGRGSTAMSAVRVDPADPRDQAHVRLRPSKIATLRRRLRRTRPPTRGGGHEADGVRGWRATEEAVYV